MDCTRTLSPDGRVTFPALCDLRMQKRRRCMTRSKNIAQRALVDGAIYRRVQPLQLTYGGLQQVRNFRTGQVL
jgi:hypothetical protein